MDAHLLAAPHADGYLARRRAEGVAVATVAKELGETSLMFRVDPTVSEAEIERTGEVVAAVMAEATA